MKINQVSRASDDSQEILRKILAYLVGKYPLLQEMEFSLEPYSFDSYPVQENIGGSSSARAINSDAGSFAYSQVKGGGTQKAYSFELDIDIAYKNDLNVGTTSEGLIRQLQQQQLRLATKVAKDVLTDVISGDGIDKEILGLKTFIKDVADASGQGNHFGLSQEQIQSCLIQSPVQLTLNKENEKVLREFDELLTSTLADVEGNPVLVMNSALFGRMNSIAKFLGQYGETVNSFGQKVTQYGNHKMVPVPLNLYPQNESDGTNSDCSSLFIVSYDEADGVRYATNTGFQFKDFDITEKKPSGKSRLDFIGNLKVENPASIRRVSRLRL